jgi:hypothetical protein
MENTMKHFTPTGRRTRQAILLSALLAASAGVNAAGTAAGTAVDNTATLSYSVGTVEQTDINAFASFLVDNKVDVLVTGGETVTTGVVPGATAVATTFTVTNQGNATQDFALNVTAVAGNFTPESCAVTKVDDVSATHIDALAADASATVTVTCNIPSGVTNGNTGLVALVATARTNDGAPTLGGTLTETGTATSGIDIVFADGAGSDDVARDAAHSARNTYTVTTAVLSVAKTVATICDPFNGTTNPKNIPGAYVQYAITVSNASGSPDATLTQVEDTLVSELAFDGTLISGGAGTAAECASGGPSLSASGFGVVSGTGTTTSSHTAPGVAADAVTAGASVDLTGKVTIDYSTLAKISGTVLTSGTLPANSYITVYFNAIIQ